MVQLATGTKRKVTHKLPKTAIQLNGFSTEVNLNILPLGSYDLLIGMDWLEKKKALMNCWDKTLHCVDEEGKPFTLKGKPKPIIVRQISALQLKRTAREGYQVYAVHVEEIEQQTEEELLDAIPVIREFKEVFPKEIPHLPPKREIDFSIDLVPGATPVSRVPYRMSPRELMELKMQLQELLDKRYIRPSVSP